MDKLKILGVGGSLRKGSFSKGLLLEVKKLAPENVDFEIWEDYNFPPYNPDTEIPENVKELKNKIKNADAILFSLPEYNYSVPGFIKNAIDWASRPYGDNSWEDKPAAIMSESIGNTAGSKAQYHLRQVLVCLNVHALNKPEFMVPNATDKFDKEGNLIDEEARGKIKPLIEALVAWTNKLK
ncbi:MAG: NAD(P)H-dependent oxidoreductase [Patescibacteria group bacterium]|nr:NAD(P)H-dependent oxidoreductase [Patescibacteria group bacterium]